MIEVNIFESVEAGDVISRSEDIVVFASDIIEVTDYLLLPAAGLSRRGAHFHLPLHVSVVVFAIGNSVEEADGLARYLSSLRDEKISPASSFPFPKIKSSGARLGPY